MLNTYIAGQIYFHSQRLCRNGKDHPHRGAGAGAARNEYPVRASGAYGARRQSLGTIFGHRGPHNTQTHLPPAHQCRLRIEILARHKPREGVCIHRRRDVDALRLHARRTDLRQWLAARRPYNIRTQRAAVPSDSCGRRRAASARRGRPLPRPRCRRNALVRRGGIFVDDGCRASGCRLGNTPQRHRPAADARTRRGGDAAHRPQLPRHRVYRRRRIPRMPHSRPRSRSRAATG